MNDPEQREQLFDLAVDGLVEQGYAVIDGFLPENLTNRLAAHFHLQREQDAFSPASIGQGTANQQNRSIRGDLIHWLRPETAAEPEQQFLDLMQELMAYLNRTCYLGVHDCEFHYAIYPVGTFYKRHLDQFRSDDARVLSVVTYLNSDWQEGDGGEIVLYLPENNGEKALKILPAGGRTVLFRSAELEHEVLPASRERMSITGWLRREKVL